MRHTVRLNIPAAGAAALVWVASSCGVTVDRSWAPQLECTDGICECVGSYRNCDGDLSNGCEVDVSRDPLHCGVCHAACGEGHCVDGACECNDGWLDCEGEGSLVCESELATSSSHCGVCDHDCHGGSCVGGQCQPFTLIANGHSLHNLALTSSHLFWQHWDWEGSTIDLLALPLGASEVVLLDRGPEDCRTSITAEGATVYWGCDAGIQTMTVGDAEPTMLYPHAHVHSFYTSGIAVGTEHLFWREGSVNDDPFPLLRASKAGSGPVDTIHPNTDGGPILTSEYVYLVPRSTHRSIRRAPLTGTDSELFDDMNIKALHAVFDGYVYFTAWEEEDLWRKAESAGAAGTAERILERSIFETTSLAVDESGVYVVSESDGLVAHLDVDTGELTSIADGQSWPAYPQVNATSLYWLSYDSVMRWAK